LIEVIFCAGVNLLTESRFFFFENHSPRSDWNQSQDCPRTDNGGFHEARKQENAVKTFVTIGNNVELRAMNMIYNLTNMKKTKSRRAQVNLLSTDTDSPPAHCPDRMQVRAIRQWESFRLQLIIRFEEESDKTRQIRVYGPIHPVSIWGSDGLEFL
jgi:hypothetical protein